MWWTDFLCLRASIPSWSGQTYKTLERTPKSSPIPKDYNRRNKPDSSSTCGVIYPVTVLHCPKKPANAIMFLSEISTVITAEDLAVWQNWEVKNGFQSTLTTKQNILMHGRTKHASWKESKHPKTKPRNNNTQIPADLYSVVGRYKAGRGDKQERTGLEPKED